MKKKFHKHKKSLSYFLLLILISVAVVFSPDANAKPMAMDPFLIEDYVYVEPDMDGMTLYLSSDCYEVSMVISDTQALAIQNELEGNLARRPLTQDIMKDVIDHFGLEVIMAKIEDYEDGIYYARLFIVEGNKILELDSRPSDAVAIALRANAPIYFKKGLLESLGANNCEQ